MTNITCDIMSCCYNANNQCYAGHIQVSEKAQRDQNNQIDTCCDSYFNKEIYSNMINSVDWHSPNDYVLCKVSNCRYYEKERCKRDTIHLSGNVNASTYLETHCSSFEER